MADQFLPSDYKVPSSGGAYMKFQQGNNHFRILSSAVTGYEGWGDKKPIRRKKLSEFSDLSQFPDDFEPEKIRHFWAMVVWDYSDSQVKILEITQKSILKTIHEYAQDEAWGDPKQYDIVVSRSGQGMETEYSVKVKPKSETPVEAQLAYKPSNINLEKLFTGDNPFSVSEDDGEEESFEELDSKELPPGFMED